MAVLRIAFLGDPMTNGAGDPTMLGWVGRVRASAWGRGDGAHPGAKGYAAMAALVEEWPAWRAWLA